ncbi:MAG: hypothetical protein ABWX90_00810 [Candidatus Saccharimonadales bacterium]
MALLIEEIVWSLKKKARCFMMKNVMKKFGFYANRLRKENVTKVVAASVASLALVLQLTVGLLPFTGTAVNAAGDDNIIRNGISSKEELLAMYDSGTDNAGHNDIQQIYTHFGITRQDIANSTMGSYKTNDFNGQIKSIGRTNWPNAGRTAVQVAGSSTSIYTGPFLDNANSQAFKMPALIGQRSIDGQWFGVTLDCGNIVYTVTPPTPPKPPKPTPPAPKPTPLARCDSIDVEQISRTEFEFSSRYTAENVTYKSTEYVVTNEANQEVARTSATRYVQETPGAYTVQAYITFVEDGKDKVVTSSKCAEMFTVAAVVTPIATTPMCDVPGKEHLPKNSPDCVVTPVATPPQELPKTGLGEELLKVTGVGSLIAAIGYYAASRRGLLSAFLNR